MRLPETDLALEASINHWQDLLDQARGLAGGHGIGYASCNLCERFNKDGAGDCTLGDEVCPVYERTGLDHCDGSPYEDVQDCWHDRASGDPELIRLVQAELDFLKSLRNS